MINVIFLGTRLFLATFLLLAAYGKVQKRIPHELVMTPAATITRGASTMPAPATTHSVKIDNQPKIQPGTIVTDVIGTMRKSGNFNTLITLLNIANLTNLVRSSDALTLFAPTDEAFAKLPKALSIETLQKPSKRKVLIHLLTYHMLPHKLLSSDLQSLKTIKTLNGKRLQVTVNQSILSINDIQLSNVNLQASNGVIHAVDAVLLPPSKTITSSVILVQRAVAT